MLRATRTEAKGSHEHPQQARAEHDRHSSLVEMLLFLLQHRPALLWVAECRVPVAFRWFYRKQEVIFIIRAFHSVFSETETSTPPQNTVLPWRFLEYWGPALSSQDPGFHCSANVSSFNKGLPRWFIVESMLRTVVLELDSLVMGGLLYDISWLLNLY